MKNQDQQKKLAGALIISNPSASDCFISLCHMIVPYGPVQHVTG